MADSTIKFKVSGLGDVEKLTKIPRVASDIANRTERATAQVAQRRAGILARGAGVFGQLGGGRFGSAISPISAAVGLGGAFAPVVLGAIALGAAFKSTVGVLEQQTKRLQTAMQFAADLRLQQQQARASVEQQGSAYLLSQRAAILGGPSGGQQAEARKVFEQYDKIQAERNKTLLAEGLKNLVPQAQQQLAATRSPEAKVLSDSYLVQQRQLAVLEKTYEQMGVMARGWDAIKDLFGSGVAQQIYDTKMQQNANAFAEVQP